MDPVDSLRNSVKIKAGEGFDKGIPYYLTYSLTTAPLSFAIVTFSICIFITYKLFFLQFYFLYYFIFI
jgi:hypothetical protein